MILTFVDVAIGMILVFTIVSLMASAIMEIIQGLIFNLRGNLLLLFLKRIGGEVFAQNFLKQPQIETTRAPSIFGRIVDTPTSITEKTAKQSAKDAVGPNSRLPAYIPSPLFANTLISMAREGQTSVINAYATDDMVKLVSGIADDNILKELILRRIPTGQPASPLTAWIDKLTINAPEFKRELWNSAKAIMFADEEIKQKIPFTLGILRARGDADLANQPQLHNLFLDAVSRFEKTENALTVEKTVDEWFYILEGFTPPSRVLSAVATLLAPDPFLELRAFAATEPIRGTVLEQLVLEAIEAGRGAQGRVDVVKEYLVNWFDERMEVLTSWYKRYTQIWLFTVGLAMAFILNIDAVTIFQHLMTDSALRESIVQQAPQVAEAAMRTPTPTVATPDATSEQGETPEATVVPTNQPTGAITPVGIHTLEELQLPVGWAAMSCRVSGTGNASVALQTRACTDVLDGLLNNTGLNLFSLLVGWLITGLSVTQGAVFWFDLLNKITNLRAGLKIEAENEGKK